MLLPRQQMAGATLLRKTGAQRGRISQILRVWYAQISFYNPLQNPIFNKMVILGAAKNLGFLNT
jgi:hypothetical protein